MKKIQIQVSSGWETLDLYDNKPTVATYAVNSIGEVASRESNFSDTISLPQTDHNCNLLGIPTSINSLQDIVYRASPCRILENDIQTIFGFMYVGEIEKDIKVDIIGGNIDFFNKIEGKSLKDIPLTGFDHTYSLADILASQDNTWNDGYVYPLLNFGKVYSYDLVQKPHRDIGAGMFVDEMQACFFVKKLVDGIVKLNGFTMAGSFINDDAFNRLIITNNEVFEFPDEYTKERSCKVSRQRETAYEAFAAESNLGGHNYREYVSLDNDFKNDYYDGKQNNYNPVTSKYTADVPMLVKCSFEIPIDKSNFHGKCKAECIMLKNDTVNVGVVGKEWGSGILSNAKGVKLAGDFPVVQLNAGDTLKLQLYFGATSDLYNYIMRGYIDERCFWTIEMLPIVLPGSKVLAQSFIPKINQTDLLLSIACQYFLLFKTDIENKILYIDKFEEVIKKIPEAIDWSDRLDFSAPPVLSFKSDLYGQKSFMNYGSDDVDELLKKNTGYGNGTIPVYNQGLDPEKVVFESVFSATVDWPAFSNNYKLPYIPTYVIKEKKRYAIWSENDKYTSQDIQDYVYHNTKFYKANGVVMDYQQVPGVATDNWFEVSYGEVLDLFTKQSIKPRILLLDDNTNYPVDIYDVNNTKITINRHASFVDLKFDTKLLIDNYQPLINVLKGAKYLKALMRLNSLDIERYTHRPDGHLFPIQLFSNNSRYGERISGVFYISQIIQYPHDGNKSCYVEFMKIDDPKLKQGVIVTEGNYILLEDGNFLLTEDGVRLEL